MPLDEPQDNIFWPIFPRIRRWPMSFLFDDGEKNVYDKALPIFEKYGFRATIPVVAGMVADKDDDPFWGSWANGRMRPIAVLKSLIIPCIIVIPKNYMAAILM